MTLTLQISSIQKYEMLENKKILSRIYVYCVKASWLVQYDNLSQRGIVQPIQNEQSIQVCP